MDCFAWDIFNTKPFEAPFSHHVWLKKLLFPKKSKIFIKGEKRVGDIMGSSFYNIKTKHNIHHPCFWFSEAMKVIGFSLKVGWISLRCHRLHKDHFIRCLLPTDHLLVKGRCSFSSWLLANWGMSIVNWPSGEIRRTNKTIGLLSDVIEISLEYILFVVYLETISS